jgi:hypothetical protein
MFRFAKLKGKNCMVEAAKNNQGSNEAQKAAQEKRAAEQRRKEAEVAQKAAEAKAQREEAAKQQAAKEQEKSAKQAQSAQGKEGAVEDKPVNTEVNGRLVMTSEVSDEKSSATGESESANDIQEAPEVARLASANPDSILDAGTLEVAKGNEYAANLGSSAAALQEKIALPRYDDAIPFQSGTINAAKAMGELSDDFLNITAIPTDHSESGPEVAYIESDSVLASEYNEWSTAIGRDVARAAQLARDETGPQNDIQASLLLESIKTDVAKLGRNSEVKKNFLAIQQGLNKEADQEVAQLQQSDLKWDGILNQSSGTVAWQQVMNHQQQTPGGLGVVAQHESMLNQLKAGQDDIVDGITREDIGKLIPGYDANGKNDGLLKDSWQSVKSLGEENIKDIDLGRFNALKNLPIMSTMLNVNLTRQALNIGTNITTDLINGVVNIGQKLSSNAFSTQERGQSKLAIKSYEEALAAYQSGDKNISSDDLMRKFDAALQAQQDFGEAKIELQNKIANNNVQGAKYLNRGGAFAAGMNGVLWVAGGYAAGSTVLQDGARNRLSHTENTDLSRSLRDSAFDGVSLFGDGFGGKVTSLGIEGAKQVFKEGIKAGWKQSMKAVGGAVAATVGKDAIANLGNFAMGSRAVVKNYLMRDQNTAIVRNAQTGEFEQHINSDNYRVLRQAAEAGNGDNLPGAPRIDDQGRLVVQVLVPANKIHPEALLDDEALKDREIETANPAANQRYIDMGGQIPKALDETNSLVQDVIVKEGNLVNALTSLRPVLNAENGRVEAGLSGAYGNIVAYAGGGYSGEDYDTIGGRFVWRTKTASLNPMDIVNGRTGLSGLKNSQAFVEHASKEGGVGVGFSGSTDSHHQEIIINTDKTIHFNNSLNSNLWDRQRIGANKSDGILNPMSYSAKVQENALELGTWSNVTIKDNSTGIYHTAFTLLDGASISQAAIEVGPAGYSQIAGDTGGASYVGYITNAPDLIRNAPNFRDGVDEEELQEFVASVKDTGSGAMEVAGDIQRGLTYQAQAALNPDRRPGGFWQHLTGWARSPDNGDSARLIDSHSININS